MPLQGQHACIIKPSSQFDEDSFRTQMRDHDGRPYSVIMGKMKDAMGDGDPMVDHSYHYATGEWSEADARTHCGDHDGTFEPAAAETKAVRSGVMERRTLSHAELRVVAQAGRTRLQGYGAVFNSMSEELCSWWETFYEMIAPGAFAECLASGPDVRCLWQHDPGFVFGRTVSGTLDLLEDDRGLAYDCLPVDSQWSRDAMETIRRGDVSQSSFAFVALDEHEEKKDGHLVRVITKANVFDVSPVTYPAYTETVVDARALWRAAGRDPERAVEMMDRAVRSGVGVPLPDPTMRRAISGFLSAVDRDDRRAANAELDLLERRMRMAESEVV